MYKKPLNCTLQVTADCGNNCVLLYTKGSGNFVIKDMEMHSNNNVKIALRYAFADMCVEMSNNTVWLF